ncbi:uncharacterized protein MYCFIDRAFT_173504 [Pseudocercospora fijiensis CIRAD86]|uniref:Uncharacterized protein n=1 Tax=Pseudocercospora fijiensis (strain CIRAD86) TaxID=383855 RepID=M3B589_PSEFD|nr:uncharacterized protein MYCFIDRAFT_173504 [Pseudocercospora fijiensis CIRAD86]EME84533.1 hypothetical protein MYCFIDRAFT_173504 [Pseudocercospora fijiensis CIRAD86]
MLHDLIACFLGNDTKSCLCFDHMLETSGVETTLPKIALGPINVVQGCKSGSLVFHVRIAVYGIYNHAQYGHLKVPMAATSLFLQRRTEHVAPVLTYPGPATAKHPNNCT